MRWTGGRRSGPESPANGGVPPQAGARRAPATVEVPPPADDISSAAHSRVAQLVEQPAVNRRVAGSSPASGAPQIHLSQRVLAQPRKPPRAPVRSGDGWNGPDPWIEAASRRWSGRTRMYSRARQMSVSPISPSVGGRSFEWPSGGGLGAGAWWYHG